jgi:hypothetical protein
MIIRQCWQGLRRLGNSKGRTGIPACHHAKRDSIALADAIVDSRTVIPARPSRKA